MQVIEAQRASILEPHDHLHISQIRVAISRPSTFVEDSGHAAQNFQIGLPQTDGQEPRSARRSKDIARFAGPSYDLP